MPAWVQSACDDYLKRLPSGWKTRLCEYPQANAASPGVTRKREAATLLDALDARSYVVALDNRGQCLSTEALAGQLSNWQGLGKPLDFVIGGPEGLGEPLIQRADQLWSLSPLTFPHPLVRVILTEQLYRAYTVLQGHPYHRA